ncbi:MAG: hypothetical protein ACD_61C00038G0002 [uncultured bacterium]|nr:MAG: hypothetical protein ACD_61C00038G0002 [uncultured bacterium]
MTEKTKYRLALQIIYSTDDGLESAIAIFNAWCREILSTEHVERPARRTKNRIKLGYGFVKTKNHSGELFLISSRPFEGWMLHLLVKDLEMDGLVHFKAFSCPEIVENPKPAS